MILYLDTSALVKRYVVEAGSKEVSALIEQSETVGSAILTRVEMASTLAKAVRMYWVETADSENAWQDFLLHWQSFLATALAWQEKLEMPITLATFDRELWLAGQKAGLTVWPEGLVS